MSIKTFVGTVTSVSKPQVYTVSKKDKVDYYHITMSDLRGRVVLVYVSIASLGFFSEQQSKIYFFDKKRNKWMKHRMATPARLKGQRLSVTGKIELRQEGLYMNNVSAIKILQGTGS